MCCLRESLKHVETEYIGSVVVRWSGLWRLIPSLLLFFFSNIYYLFIWLYWFLVVACLWVREVEAACSLPLLSYRVFLNHSFFLSFQNGILVLAVVAVLSVCVFVYMSVPTLYVIYPYLRASLVALLVKNPPAMWETLVRSLGQEDPLEKGKAIHSSVLTWRIPWTV